MASNRGRPRKPYRTSWGEYVNGLRRRSDGRWVIVETGETFTESDERRAVAKFRRWEAEQQRESITELSIPLDAFESQAGVDAAFEGGATLQVFWNGEQRVGLEASEPALWHWFREQLIERPEYVAEKTGIPEVARLADLPQPQPSPTLKEVGQLYHDKAQVKQKQRRQMQLFWDHFRDWMAEQGVETLRQLTPAVVAEYGDHVRGNGDSAKYIKNRFNSIRGVINFAKKRGLHAPDVRHALDCCAVLEAPKVQSQHDPRPISREDFSVLLKKAKQPRTKAWLLCMLNLCMYPGEALNLDWGEIDMSKGTVVTSRSKTNVVRVGVLWPRTINALKEIRPSQPRPDTPVFCSQQGARLSIKQASKQFRELRAASGVADWVKAEHCRDGAYTAAIEAGVDLTQAKLLAGHATGISDHYAKRRPTMVRDAIEAIANAYFDRVSLK